ncbi:hypothetical protein GX51_01532 [Blastomyces parvus]|uniref:Uncharacterized protein n=1 Tax=Blastomyces parvus TaxID=2060905 RepID=A0A2B7XGI9_9EURO|nr:hypothetical protein GX51_01532 [Blastomyces parvus]
MLTDDGAVATVEARASDNDAEEDEHGFTIASDRLRWTLVESGGIDQGERRNTKDLNHSSR